MQAGVATGGLGAASCDINKTFGGISRPIFEFSGEKERAKNLHKPNVSTK